MKMAEVKTLRHGRLCVVLDKSQVFPDDPGAGTPAMVHSFGYHATYWCACGEGELTENRRGGTTKLTKEELDWLDAIQPEIEEFIYGGRK
jgi:hypothetical protein